MDALGAVSSLFDERGWSTRPLAPLGVDDAISVYVPAGPIRLSSFDLASAARALGFELRLEPEKHYPSGTIPLADEGVFTLTGSAEHRATVRVVPSERAGDVVLAGIASAALAGGQGMDVLVRRCRAVVQVFEASSDGAALLTAALFARAHLGPIRLPTAPGQPPHAGLFGLKGARERLAALGLIA